MSLDTAHALMLALLLAALLAGLCTGFPVAFVLGGVALLVAGLGMLLGTFDPSFLQAFPSRIFGTVTNETLVAVPLFVFMGIMLEKSRIAEALLEAVAALFGRVRGGLAVAVLLVGAILAASTGIVGATVVAMGLISLVFRGYGGDDLVHEALSGMPGGKVGAIAIVMLVMFVLGFVLDFIEIVFVVVPIVAPVLLAMGVSPVWLGVMMAVNLQTSFLTPPFGFALFYLRGVAPPQVRTADIYRGVLPFIVLQLLVLGVLAVFPALATWLPAQLYR